MGLKHNPLKLNGLQLRTLAILQAMTHLPGAAIDGPGAGEVTLEQFPHAHGDHFHLGGSVVATKDATGVYNEKVWNALERKGLARADWPHRITLTPSGQQYETGLAEELFHGASH